MRASPQFNKGDGLIKLISSKGNLNIIRAHLLRNLSERERDDEQPKTDLVLLHNDNMPDYYTVKVPIRIMEVLWRYALNGHDVDLTPYSGENGAYMADIDLSVLGASSKHAKPRLKIPGYSGLSAS